MNEIADRLRNWRLVHLTQLRYLMETASDEIERLQALADKRGELAVDRRREIERLRQVVEQKNITDAERWALKYFAAFDRSPRERDAAAAATIRSLLSRTGTNSRQTSDDAAECGSNGDKTPEREHLSAAECVALAEASDFYVGTRTGLALRSLLERMK